jgi:hypothetical protein
MGSEATPNKATITHLSFSRLKALAHSPQKLEQYLTGDKPSTDAMVEGSLFDCLLFEPEKLNERFFVIEKPDRRTKEGKAQWEAAIDQAGSRTLVTTAQMEDCRFLESRIRENSTVAFHGLLHPENFNFQVEVKFFYNGFMHKGIKDADGTDRDGNRVIWDLKRMGAASGERLVRSSIRANKYDLQAAIYCHEFDSKNEPVKYYVIAVDNDGFVTPFEISRDAREQARIEWNVLVRAAHRLNMDESLSMGCEFWAGASGFFQY